jgi:K+-transporting ATPase c subunit
MLERDRRSASLKAAQAAHPSGSGLHPDIRHASNMLEAAQIAQTNHLQNCPQCQAWLAWIDQGSTYFEPDKELTDVQIS